MRKLIVAGGALAAVFVIFSLLLSALVDEAAFEHTLVQALSAETGRPVAVNGGASLSVFPLPAITLREVFVGNGPGGYAGYLASAKAVHGRLQLGALLRGEARLARLVIDGLELNLEISAQGAPNWRFDAGGAAAPQAPAAGASLETLGIPSEVHITSGTISLQTGAAASETHRAAVRGLTLDVSALPAMTVEGELTFRDTAFEIAAAFGNVRGAEGPVRASVTAGGASTLTLDGTGLADLFAPRFAGTAAFESTDAGALLAVFFPTACARDEAAPAIPLAASARTALSQESVTVESLTLTSGTSTVQAEGSYRRTEAPLRQTLDMTVAVPALDLDPILPEYRRLFGAACRRPGGGPAQPRQSSAFDMSIHSGLLPDTMEARFSGTAARIRINGRDMTGLAVNAQAGGSGIVINQLSGTLPGGTSLSAFGLLSQRADANITFDGGMEASGASLREVLAWLNASFPTSNPAVLGAYGIKAAFALSGTEIRLTEASGHFDQTRFAGVTVTDFGSRPSSEIRVRFDQLNLDDYLPAAQEAQSGLVLRGTGTGNPVEWIRRVTYQLRFGVGGNRFVFHGRPYDDVYGVGTLKDQKLALEEFRFTSGGATSSGRFSIDTARKAPFFEADITSSAFHTGLLLRTQQGGAAARSGTAQVSQKWTGGKFDLALLEHFDGVFTVRAQELIHDGFTVHNATATGKLADGTLRIDPLVGRFAGGDLEVRAEIAGGAVPGLSAAFSLANADAVPFLQYLPSAPVTGGRISTRGSVKTTGINFYSWMINMEGSIAVSAKNLVFAGADITGFARRLTNIRSVADVVTVAKQAFSGGETIFTLLEGGMVIEKGTGIISNLQLKGEGIAGIFRGRIDLPHWTGVGLAELKLAVAGSADMPTLAIKLNGSVDQPDLQIETADVETFIARRSTQQGLRPQ